MLAPTAPDLPLEPGAQAPLRRNRPIPNAGVLVAALLGVVAGSALQMQQPSLWTATAYAACMGAALVLGIFALKLRSGHGRLASVPDLPARVPAGRVPSCRRSFDRPGAQAIVRAPPKRR